MNNRTQQRFDRSIREAIAATKSAHAYDHAEALAHQWEAEHRKAVRLLPTVIRALESGTLKGERLTTDQRHELKSLRKDLEQWLVLRAIA